MGKMEGVVIAVYLATILGLLVAPFTVAILIKGGHQIAGLLSIAAIVVPLLSVFLFAGILALSQRLVLIAVIIMLIGTSGWLYIFGVAVQNLSERRKLKS